MCEQVHGPRVMAVCDQTQGALRKEDITAPWQKKEDGTRTMDSVS